MECLLNLVDPLFDPGHTLRYRLSILLRPDGFSFSVLDNRTFTFLALSDFKADPGHHGAMPRNDSLCEIFRKQFQSVDLLKYQYARTDLVYASPKVTLVPPSFINEESIGDYFRFNHVLDTAEVISSQRIPVGDMLAIFSMPACVGKLAKEQFRIHKPGSSAAVLIQGLLKANAHILARQVFVNVWPDFFDIIIIQGYKLLYYNTFRRQAPEDMVYFIVYVLEQMGFVPAEEEVTLTGNIDAASEDYQLLSAYIDRLKFGNLSAFAEFSPSFKEVLVHKYFALFNLPFCE